MSRQGKVYSFAIALVAGGLCCLQSVPAKAGNYDGILVGNEAAMTGGAITAVVVSGAAMWYNPAGLATFDESLLDLGGTGFNVRIFGGDGPIATSDLEVGEQRVIDTAFVPSAVAVSFNVGPDDKSHRLGVGVFATYFQDTYRRTRLTVDNPGSTVDATMVLSGSAALYHVPVTYALRINRNLQFGASVQLVVGTERYAQRSTLVETDHGSQQVLALWEQTKTVNSLSFGLRASAGLQWQLNDSFRLGVSLLTPSRIFLSNRYAEGFETAPAGQAQTARVEHADEFRFRFTRFEPMRLRVGLAYLWDRGWISVEGDISTRRENEFFGRQAGVVGNARLGFMHRTGEHLVVGAGLFTDLQAYEGDFEPDEYRVNYYGGTLGMRYGSEGLQKGRDVEFGITVAPRYAYGDGRQGVWVIDTQTPATSLGVTDRSITVHELGVHVGADLAWK